jgi:acyl-CoA thioester hydrolase
MIFTESLIHTIPFHDVDLMNIVWHGHYYKYFELARTVLMQALGLDWPVIKDLGYAMPIVSASAEYRKALTYGLEVSLEAAIKETQFPALEVHYAIVSPDRKTTYAFGKTKQVYLQLPNLEACLAVPDPIAARFTAAKNQRQQTR